MLRCDKATYLSLLFQFVLSERLINSLWGSDVLVFSELMKIASVLFYNFVKFIILLYTFLIISFARYKEYEIYLVLFSKFSDVLPDFTCTSPIGNLCSICLGFNTSRYELSETLPRATHTAIK